MTTNVMDILRLIVDLMMGGSLIVTLFTLRSTRRKASEDARSAAIENDKSLMQGFKEYIVEPLKKEVNALRKDVRRLYRAIEKINDCPHAGNCPVRNELQDTKDSQCSDQQPDAI